MKTLEIKKITPHFSINKLLHSITKAIVNLFGKDLIGLYLFGSLTYDDFNFGRSDIDLVAVLSKPALEKQIKLINKLHLKIAKENKKWAKRIECSYTPIKMFNSKFPPKSPRPYFGQGILYPKVIYGNEWLINNYLLYKYGLALVGPDFKKLVKPIKITDVKKACLKDLTEEWMPKIKKHQYFDDSHRQSYVILNLCRILYTLKRGFLASKRVSALWVKNKYKEWKNLIQTAESWTYGKKMSKQKQVIRFIKFVNKEVNKRPS